MTIKEALKALSHYPIPSNVIEKVVLKRGLDGDGEAPFSEEQANFKLAHADIYAWLALAPNISQGGQSYSLSVSERVEFKRYARAIYDALEPDNLFVSTIFGYKGSRL